MEMFREKIIDFPSKIMFIFRMILFTKVLRSLEKSYMDSVWAKSINVKIFFRSVLMPSLVQFRFL